MKELGVLKTILTNEGHFPMLQGDPFAINDMAIIKPPGEIDTNKLMFICSVGQLAPMGKECSLTHFRNPPLSEQNILPFHIENDAEKAKDISEYLYSSTSMENGLIRTSFYYKQPTEMYFIKAINNKMDQQMPPELLKIETDDVLKTYQNDTPVAFIWSLDIQMDEMSYITELQEVNQYINVVATYFGYPRSIGGFNLYGIPLLKSTVFDREQICPGKKSLYTKMHFAFH